MRGAVGWGAGRLGLLSICAPIVMLMSRKERRLWKPLGGDRSDRVGVGCYHCVLACSGFRCFVLVMCITPHAFSSRILRAATFITATVARILCTVPRCDCTSALTLALYPYCLLLLAGCSPIRHGGSGLHLVSLSLPGRRALGEISLAPSCSFIIKPSLPEVRDPVANEHE